MTSMLTASPVIEESGATIRLTQIAWSDQGERTITVLASSADSDFMRRAFNQHSFRLADEGFSRRNLSDAIRKFCRYDREARVNHYRCLILEHVVGGSA